MYVAGHFADHKEYEASRELWGLIGKRWKDYRCWCALETGNVYLEEGEYQQAINTYEEVITDDECDGELKLVVRYFRSECNRWVAVNNYSIVDRNLTEKACEEMIRISEAAIVSPSLANMAKIQAALAYRSLEKNSEGRDLLESVEEVNLFIRAYKSITQGYYGLADGDEDIFLFTADIVLREFLRAPATLQIYLCSLTRVEKGLNWRWPSIPVFNNSHETNICKLAVAVAQVHRKHGNDELAYAVWIALLNHPDAPPEVLEHAYRETGKRPPSLDDGGIWQSGFSVDTSSIDQLIQGVEGEGINEQE